MWVNHHALFSYIGRTDRLLLFLNSLLLMCIAFVPFPTSVLAQHLRQPGQQTAAAVMYGATMTVTAVFFNLLWRYAAVGRRLLHETAPQREVDDITRSYTPGPFIYSGAAALSFASAWVAAALFLAIAGFFALPPSIMRR